jgi:hypothetical protein
VELRSPWCISVVLMPDKNSRHQQLKKNSRCRYNGSIYRSNVLPPDDENAWTTRISMYGNSTILVIDTVLSFTLLSRVARFIFIRRQELTSPKYRTLFIVEFGSAYPSRARYGCSIGKDFLSTETCRVFRARGVNCLPFKVK